MARGKRARSMVSSSSEDDVEIPEPSSEHNREEGNSEFIPFADRFLKKAARDFYTKMVGRTIVPERQLVVDDPSMLKIITDRHWEYYLAESQPHYPTLIWEFYCNAAVAERHLSSVRDVDINGNLGDISRITGIPIQDPTVYKEFLKDKDPDMIKNRIAKPKANWDYGKNGTKLCGILMTELNPEGRFWFDFIRYNIMPTTVGTIATYDRCQLVYAILEGVEISLPHILHAGLVDDIRHLKRQIQTMENEEKQQKKKPEPKGKGQPRNKICSLPSLIMHILEDSRVPRYGDDFPAFSIGPITYEISHEADEEEEHAEEEVEAPPLPLPKPARTTTTRLEAVERELQELRAEARKDREEARRDREEVRKELAEARRWRDIQLPDILTRSSQFTLEAIKAADLRRDGGEIPHPPIPSFTPTEDDARN